MYKNKIIFMKSEIFIQDNFISFSHTYQQLKKGFTNNF